MPGGTELDKKVSRQSEVAIRDADVVLFVLDSTVGVTDEDAGVADLLRRLDRPIIVIANKVDHTRHEAAIWDLMSLGLGEPVPISALHGRGTGDLLDVVVSLLPEPEDAEEEQPEDVTTGDERAMFSVALVGRPNVGKSTLFNR